MRNHHRTYRSVLCGVIALSAALMALSVVAVKPAMAYGGADAQASDLVRLINGERADHGLRQLRVDTFLAGKARDGAVACPNDSSKVMSGRAKDWADFGYPSNAHALRLCPTYTSMDAMKMWGYNTYRGEITAINGGYGTGSVTYTFGCTPTLRTCPGDSTTTYHTTAVAMGNWTSSSGHYAIVVGNYDRVGCGAWIGTNGAFFYDCMFSLGGRSTPKPPATPKPAAPRPISGTSTRVVVRTTPTLGVQDVTPALLRTSPSMLGPATVNPTPTVTPSPTVVPAPTSNPTLDTENLAKPLSGGPQSGPPDEGLNRAPTVTRNLSVAAGAASAALSLGFWLISSFWQRRRNDRIRRPD